MNNTTNEIKYRQIIGDAYSMLIDNQELLEALYFIMKDPEDIVDRFENESYPLIFSATNLIKLIRTNNENLLKLTGL